MNTTALDKQAFRDRFRAARLALSDAEAAAGSEAICERIAATPEVRAAQTVHVYWPLVARREVDTRPLIHALWNSGTTLVLPVVAAFEGAPVLRHVRYEGDDHMAVNRWGIAEPVGTAEVDPAALDAIVVPAFGAGRNGHRVGHGHGFYDAFLAHATAPAIGAVWASTFVDAVPIDSHDVALDVIVTEDEVWRPARS